MLIVLEIAPEMKGCAAAIIRMWLSGDKIARADAATWRRAIEDGQMLDRKVRRFFQRHCATAIGAGRGDLRLRETEAVEHVETEIVELGVAQAKGFYAEVLAQRPFVEDELDVVGVGERFFDGAQRGRREALGGESFMPDTGGAAQGAVADCIGHDVVDLVFGVAERVQRFRNCPVDNSEVAAARQLLEFDQREIRFDPRRIAVHHQADRAGWRDDGGLRVAKTMALAQLQRPGPGVGRGLGETRIERCICVQWRPAPPTGPRTRLFCRATRARDCV